MGYSPWGRKESDTTEQLHFFFRYLKRLSRKKKAYGGQEMKGKKKITHSLPSFPIKKTGIGNRVRES